MAAFSERVDGKTCFGSPHQGPSGVGINAKDGSFSYLSLVNPAGNELFLWCDSSGFLRIGTAVPTDPENDGTIVALQA